MSAFDFLGASIFRNIPELLHPQLKKQEKDVVISIITIPVLCSQMM